LASPHSGDRKVHLDLLLGELSHRSETRRETTRGIARAIACTRAGVTVAVAMSTLGMALLSAESAADEFLRGLGVRVWGRDVNDLCPSFSQEMMNLRDGTVR
jgi:hypothetical protein